VSDPFTPDQKEAFFDAVWEHTDPATGRSWATCPNDGYRMDAYVLKEERPRADIVVNCVRCGRLSLGADLDPRLAEFREWTDDEKQRLVDDHFQGRQTRCPVDGAAIRPSSDGDRVLLQCWRCGKRHWGDVHHRIGSQPRPIVAADQDRQFRAPSLVEPITALLDVATVAGQLRDRGPVGETPMEKRYQVFVSSTFEDLKDERHAVQQALLALGCIPAGMELFPASDDEKWTVITRDIDECDYYLLILGGRYGSLGEDGIGYTEKEFDYAIEARKPVVSFIHREPDSIPVGKSERSDKLRKKWEAFRDKAMRTKMVRHWTNPDSLTTAVSVSLPKLFKTHPAEGWVRARYASNTGEVEKLRRRIEELEALLAHAGDPGEALEPNLSKEALQLLAEAAGSATGRILANSDMGGLEFQAGDFVFREDEGGRRQASQYEAAVDSLRDAGFIRELDDGLYELAKPGYDFLERHGGGPAGQGLQRDGLPPEALHLLKEAAGSDGQILVTMDSGGFHVQVNGWAPNEVDDPKSEALYRDCLEKLESRGLIQRMSESVFQVTHSGYNFVSSKG
jgi:hypothetical protein